MNLIQLLLIKQEWVQLSFLVPDQCSSHNPVLPLSLAFQVVIGLLAEVTKYLHFLFK